MRERLCMLLLLTAGLYGLGGVAEPHAREREAAASLRASLMDTVHAMGTRGDMIAHDDVTSIVAPLFPVGQSFAETQRVLKHYELGPLKMFMGTQILPLGKMYAARFSLLSGMMSDVYVTISFDFVGTTEQNMVLLTTRAFLQSSSM